MTLVGRRDLNRRPLPPKSIQAVATDLTKNAGWTQKFASGLRFLMVRVFDSVRLATRERVYLASVGQREGTRVR